MKKSGDKLFSDPLFFYHEVVELENTYRLAFPAAQTDHPVKSCGSSKFAGGSEGPLLVKTDVFAHSRR